MDNKKPHSHLDAVDRHSKNFLAGGSFNWKRSQSDVWVKLESSLDRFSAKRFFLQTKLKLVSVAASLVILLASGLLLRFYSKTIHSPAGSHLIAELPDGSTVEMNAESTLKYYPYWHRVSRILEFEGEGFFQVGSGAKFTVASSSGKTQVMGTSFNILSREAYQVTCLTGRVKVISKTKNQVILQPNSKAEIQKDGEIIIENDIQTYPEISWRNQVFIFTATPVGQVFSEIERQYNITILTDLTEMPVYTGNFKKQQHVEEVLEYICPALGLKYTKKSVNLYVVTRDEE
ncbi:FecR family protein [Gaoshiqia sp. Z1-71]|uniref:FecR family protein n=1 Tax=Gaoshiqia hydrogeniformans TaxID=3290090 RepID=UPI003BF7E86A